MKSYESFWLMRAVVLDAVVKEPSNRPTVVERLHRRVAAEVVEFVAAAPLVQEFVVYVV